ncbi:MAG: TetR-like C-terminal domain-containing protein [Lachnospiraceae bacterium]|nr:TetR-like C-terminal domain-containing protein [Lachnospiraceae bacterium]
MKEETLDRRVRKTRKQLRHCLAVLLKEKKIQDITVREITDMADLNRGTFYLHYKDVFDLLEQIEKELLEELNEALKKYQASDLRHRPALIFSDVFQIIQDNSEMVQILLGENGDLNFVNQVKAVVREKCLKDWIEIFRGQDAALFAAYYSFVVSGALGLVGYWLQSGMKESPKELAGITERIILEGIQVLDSKEE